MYKRITHNILEEHFDSNCVEPIPPENGNGFGLMSNGRKSQQIMPPSVRYRFFSYYLFYDYLWFLQQTADDTLLNNAAKHALMLSKTLVSASNISNMVRNTFGQEYGDNLAEQLRALTQTVSDIITAMKAGTSISILRQQASQQINSMAQFLNSLSPSVWANDVVTSALEEFVNSVIARTESVIAGNWNTELLRREELRDQIIKIAELFSAGQIGPQGV